jgi:hypothetical protein
MLKTEGKTSRGIVLNYVPDYEMKPIKTLQDITIFDFVPCGSDNLFPQATALFSRTSPNHRGVINSKRDYILGGGIKTDIKELEYLLQKVNFEGQNINQVIKDCLHDRLTGGNIWIEIITDPSKSFVWFNHIDFTKCRLKKDLKTVMIHPDWYTWMGTKQQLMKELPLYPEFISEKNEYGVYVSRSVYQIKSYEPEFYYYGLPDWIAGQDSVLIDVKTGKYNLAVLKNAFVVSGFLIVPVKDKTEAETVIDYIEKNHTGEGNQAKLMVVTKSRAAEGEKAETAQFVESKTQNEGSWEKLHSMSLSDIIVSHSWFRALTSIPDNTGFDTKRILNEYNIASKTIIPSEQQIFLDFFKKIFAELKNIETDFSFIVNPPIEDYGFKYIWQIKQQRGDEDADENDPKQQEMIIPKEYFIPGKTPSQNVNTGI